MWNNWIFYHTSLPLFKQVKKHGQVIKYENTIIKYVSTGEYKYVCKEL